MTAPCGGPAGKAAAIVDYDSGFEYLAFWDNRDYEYWLEARLLRRLLPRLGGGQWFADFGGGYGRHAPEYQRAADHTILVDYSATQLTKASERLAGEIGAGRIHLIRADLAHLPLVDGAVDTAMVVRVLHHLTNLDPALREMGRVVNRRWLVDVPIKHHALARWRGLRRGSWAELRGPEPMVTGSTEYPFHTFSLAAVRRTLTRSGFHTRTAASVNNFRRWDQMFGPTLVRALRPVVYPAELLAQRLGRSWWGPSQFLFATRGSGPIFRSQAPQRGTPASLAQLAQRTCCPRCRGPLAWGGDSSDCTACGIRFSRQARFWDFTKPLALRDAEPPVPAAPG